MDIFGMLYAYHNPHSHFLWYMSAGNEISQPSCTWKCLLCTFILEDISDDIKPYVDSFFFFQNFRNVIPSTFDIHFFPNKDLASVILYIMFFFFSGCFQDFLFIFNFQQFDYDMPRYCFLCTYLNWGSLNLLDI